MSLKEKNWIHGRWLQRTSYRLTGYKDELPPRHHASQSCNVYTSHPNHLYKSPGQDGEKNIDLVHTRPKHFVWTGRRVHPCNGIHEVVANKPLEISLTIFSAVEKMLPRGIVISYALKITTILLAVTGTMETGICKFLSLMVDQATAAVLGSHQPKLRTWRLAAPEEKIPRSTNQELLLSWPVKSKHGSIQGSENLKLETRRANLSYRKIGNFW